MATYIKTLYAPDALVYDATSNTWSLRPDYDFTLHRVQATITDDDIRLEGDVYADEVGSDSTQTAEVRAMDGTLLASGQIYDEEYYELRGPDGTLLDIDRIEIGGEMVGWAVTSPLEPGTSYEQMYVSDVGANEESDNRLTYGQIAAVPCFATGTRIATAAGPVAVEHLRPGIRIRTRDHGLVPLIWAGCFAPGPTGRASVAIRPGALGPGRPSAPMRVSPQHRILLSGPAVELYYAATEVLCAAGHLAGRSGIAPGLLPPRGAWWHLLLPRHEIILADGAWCESLFLGDATATMLPAPLRRRLLTRAGTGHAATARPCLSRREALALPKLAAPAGGKAQETGRAIPLQGIISAAKEPMPCPMPSPNRPAPAPTTPTTATVTITG